jgi:DUF2075 family protein
MSLNIRSYKFERSSIPILEQLLTGNNWPVVYILENSSDAYIGETISAHRRIGNHLDNPDRKCFKRFHLIEHETFNKSATLDIEALLIEHIAADEVFMLHNGNVGLRNHNYFKKEYYQELFKEIWKELTKKGLAQKSLSEIENSDLFKYSPFKRLTMDQYDIVAQITKIIRSTENSVSIINGEPGSGKTVLAVYLTKYLLSETATSTVNIGIVLPQTSLRDTVRKIFRHVKRLKASMVLGPSDVVNSTEIFDVLIVDESHRLTQRRNLANYSTFDDACRKIGVDPIGCSQVDWILKKCRHAIFLYDSRQTVKPSDVDKHVFDKLQQTSNNFVLTSQLRVLAGEKYSHFLDDILRNKLTEHLAFSGYDLRLFKNLRDMVDAIKKLDREYGLCRLVAGYAWEWVSKENKDLFDIEIQNQQLKWNSTVKDWINSPNAPNEVGCIHTVQGYDLNYVGVIIGPELTYENGEMTFHADRYKDRYGKHSSLTDKELFSYIVNIYKTLMTRGILGTYLFACDEGLSNYLNECLSPKQENSNFMVAEPKSYYGIKEAEQDN